MHVIVNITTARLTQIHNQTYKSIIYYIFFTKINCAFQFERIQLNHWLKGSNNCDEMLVFFFGPWYNEFYWFNYKCDSGVDLFGQRLRQSCAERRQISFLYSKLRYNEQQKNDNFKYLLSNYVIDNSRDLR